MVCKKVNHFWKYALSCWLCRAQKFMSLEGMIAEIYLINIA